MPEDNETYDMVDAYSEPEASDMAILLQANEEKILNASMRALKSGSLTPLVKEELRYAIQSRRLAAGKGELKLEEFKRPPKRKPVTDEERKRAQVRKLQNREAAQRFRQRQKDQASYLSEKIKRLEKASRNLVNDMTRLKEERDELTKMLHDHLLVCTSNIPIPDSICLKLEQTPPLYTYPSTSSDIFTASPPHCPNTSDSASSVFFSDEANNNNNDDDHQTYQYLLQDLGITSIEIIQHKGTMVQDLTEAPEMGQEMIIGDADLLDSLSEHSDENRIDSCSSFETVSNFGSISSEGYPLTDSASEFGAGLAATVSVVHSDHIIHEFDNPFSTDDILLLDNMTS